jgi:hypothetical protein
MAKRITFEVQAATNAPAAAVYRLLEDGSTWPSWSPIGGFELEAEGRTGGESEGAIRVFKTGTVRSREELVELRTDTSLSYVALSGLPFRTHRADVELAANEGGTEITWREAFEPKFPGTGWLLRAFLRRFVQRCANGLAARAAADHSDLPVSGSSE